MLVCPKCGSTYTRSIEFCGLDGERLIESSSDPLIGRAIDRYQIVDAIGSGGMARVYRARHVYLEQDFAIKVLHGQIAADKSFAARFHREAKTLGKIKHRNVVAVSDFGATREGLLFLVMELLDGPSLTQVIRLESPFPPGRAAAIARQICLGLTAAHSKGFVHRDLKPANIILTKEDGSDVPKILDFGLVRLLEAEDTNNPALTAHGQLFGTPSYMSPEQVSGEEVDSRADLYSLGVIFYQMLTGSTPFSGDVAELIRAHVSIPPPRPILEYGGLTPIMMRLLEKEKEDRIQSASDVIDAIDRLGLTAAPRRASDGARLLQEPSDETRSERMPEITGDRISDTAIRKEPDRSTDPVSMEIEASARSALGYRAYWRWVVGGGLFAVVAFVLWVAEQQGMFEALRRPRAIDDAGLAIVPAPIMDGDGDRPEPTDAGKKKKKKRKKRDGGPSDPAVDPDPEPDPVPVPAPVPVPTPDPDPDPIDAGPAPSFESFDQSLGWILSARGLAWEDIQEAEPEAATRWARWYKMREGAETREILATYEVLERTARGLVIDRRLLLDKIDRARRVLDRVPAQARDERYGVLVTRGDELELGARSEPLRDAPERIAAAITLYESDAAQFLAAAQRTSTSTR
jgi:serine/threonine-protein kinase